MLKRLLLAAATGIGIWLLFWTVIFGLMEFGFEFDKPVAGIFTNGGIMAVIVAIIAVISTGVVFMKVKTKNTLVEDIIINKAKIIKAEQEDKLKAINK